MHTPRRQASESAGAPLLAGVNTRETDHAHGSSPHRYRPHVQDHADSAEAPGLSNGPELDGAGRFRIAVGGAPFMRDVLGIEGPDVDDRRRRELDTSTSARASALDDCIRHAFAPLEGVNYLVRTLRTKRSGKRLFAAACLASVLCSLIGAGVQVWAAPRHLTCAARYGSYVSCCDCMDLEIADGLLNSTAAVASSNSTASELQIPWVDDQNDRTYGQVAIATGLITLVFLYRALLHENPYLAFVALLALALQSIFDIVVSAKDIRSIIGAAVAAKVKLGFVVAALVAVLVATAALPALIRTFGLVGLKRGGLGNGAALFQHFLFQRAVAYADQLAAYTFYSVIVFSIIGRDEVQRDSDQVGFVGFSACVILSDLLAHFVLSKVVQRERTLPTIAALGTISFSIGYWCLAFATYNECYEQGVQTQHRLRQSLLQASSTGVQWREEVRLPDAPFLFLSLPSIAQTLAHSRECIASGTVFDSRTTWLILVSFGFMIVMRLLVIVTTVRFMANFYGTRQIERLFFELDDEPVVADANNVMYVEAGDEGATR